MSFESIGDDFEKQRAEVRLSEVDCLHSRRGRRGAVSHALLRDRLEAFPIDRLLLLLVVLKGRDAVALAELLCI